MLRRLAQQQITVSDLEWPFHASRAFSTVAEFFCFILHPYIFRLYFICVFVCIVCVCVAAFWRNEE